jgi:hypothetical protein
MLLPQKTQGTERDSRDPHVRRMLRPMLGALCGLVILCAASPAYDQGIPPGTLHTITATWAAPSPIGGSGTIAGYNIYRCGGTGCATAPTYAKIDPALVTTLSYVDTAVGQGNTYFYCITAVDSGAAESSCSTPVSIVVPANPNSPINIVIIAK